MSDHPQFPHDPGPRDEGPILPTPVRLGADERFRGRGVTIAFLDSGFYPHADLVEPRTRILRFVDVTDRRAAYPRLLKPDESSWSTRISTFRRSSTISSR